MPVPDGSLLRSEDMLPAAYDDLRSLAAVLLSGETREHLYQSNDLVHDTWLRLSGSGCSTWNNRTHFFRGAARVMRRILVEKARRASAIKHGGAMVRVEFDAVDSAGTRPVACSSKTRDMVEVLMGDDPVGARILVLKTFGGFTNAEIAEMDKVRERTVERRWATAKLRFTALLHTLA